VDRGRAHGGFAEGGLEEVAEVIDGDPASFEDRGEGVVLFGSPFRPGNVVVQELCSVAGC